MGTEIERKFLIGDDSWKAAADAGKVIRQGYLTTDPHRTVRVRRKGDRGFLTIKGLSTGATRAEFEWEIPVDEADAMLDTLALRPLIEKTRYTIQHAGHEWVLDVFVGDNAGLVMAEVELDSEDEEVVIPAWAVTEVTEDARYYNSALVKAPYTSW
jgi:adenylate cyclase